MRRGCQLHRLETSRSKCFRPPILAPHPHPLALALALDSNDYMFILLLAAPLHTRPQPIIHHCLIMFILVGILSALRYMREGRVEGVTGVRLGVDITARPPPLTVGQQLVSLVRGGLLPWRGVT